MTTTTHTMRERVGFVLKPIILTLLLLSVAIFSGAKDRSTTELRQLAASKLLQSPTGSATSTARRAAAANTLLTCPISHDGIAVFTAPGAGSVVLSTDDRFTPILGYTDTDIENEDSLPCCMQWWLNEMCQQMEAITEATAGTAAALTQAKTTEATYTAIEPFVTTKWSQDGGSYNYYTPKIDNQHTPTGCVATAMAQILNYEQYPKSAAFRGYYSTDGGKSYYYSNISSTYQYPYQTAYGKYYPDGSSSNTATMQYTTAQAKAIGKLMLDCGLACNMCYGADGSGTYTMEAAIGAVDCFGYSKKSIKHYYRELYTDEEWHDMIYAEIAKRHPILYSGVDPSRNVGHAFVVCGMDESGLVYVNWGARGIYDGYYAMDVSDGSLGSYSADQEAIVGWHPEPLATDKETSQWAAYDFSLTYDAEQETYTMAIPEGIYNYSTSSFQGKIKMCFADQALKDTVSIPLITADNAIKSSYGYIYSSQEVDLDFLEKGHSYTVYLTSQATGEATPQLVRTTGGPLMFTMNIPTDAFNGLSQTQMFGMTAIEQTEVSTARKHNVYNIRGEKVDETTRGLVIEEGRKIVKE